MGAVLCLPESVAFSIGFENLDSVRRASRMAPVRRPEPRSSDQFSNGEFVLTITYHNIEASY